MREIEEFTDERQKSWCLHCGAPIDVVPTNRDHVPSKTLLEKPYPANLPVIPICRTCNASFAGDEEYVTALLSVVRTGSTDPATQISPRVGRMLRRAPKLRARLEAAKKGYRTRGGDTRIVWNPEEERVRRVIVKNARGHAFFEVGEPMLEEPTDVGLLPVGTMTTEQLEAFDNVDMGIGWPEVGSRMMTRLLTGEDLDDGWVVVQDGVYRYAVMYTGPMLVRMVLGEYLAAEVRWNLD